MIKERKEKETEKKKVDDYSLILIYLLLLWKGHVIDNCKTLANY